MASLPSVNTYYTTNNPPRALRRIEGQASLTRAINNQAMRPDPVPTTPHPTPIAMNQNFPDFGHGVVSPSVFGEQTAMASATTGLDHPTRQSPQPNVLQERRPSRASTSPASSSLGWIVSHLPCFGHPSVSETSPLSIGEPYLPLHLMSGPEGEDVEMVQYPTYVGRVPVIKVTLAPDVDQFVPNAMHTAWNTRRNSMSSGPHLTVGDAWSPGDSEYKRVTFEEEALKPAVFEHQMAAVNNRALARHLEYLETLAQASAVSSEQPAELDGNSSGPIFMCPVHGLFVQTDDLLQGDHDPTELPATPPSEPHELEATSPEVEFPGQSAFLLPQLQQFRATMDFEGLLDGELFELDAQPQNSTGTC
jgi:hypothetical protein